MAATSTIALREKTRRQRGAFMPAALQRYPFQYRRTIAEFLTRTPRAELPCCTCLRKLTRIIFLTLVAEAVGEGARALAGDVHEAGIAGDLIEHGQDALRFRQKAAVEIGFELQQGVVDSQPVVFHAPRNQIHMFLLTRQPLKNLQKL